MKASAIRSFLGTAIVLLTVPVTAHQHQHHHSHHVRHSHDHLFQRSEETAISRRDGQCQFPTNDPNMVAVTLDQANGGWAMSPDQKCKPGNYCPFACKPGMVMAQWDPDSNYESNSRMNGGLYCDNSGKVTKPFTDKPNCVKGTGTVAAVNKCKGKMSWCQTVLPGNEAMLIPTLVDSIATLAVPDPSYWQGTAAHFYINPPGVGEEGCIWGDDGSPVGNWSPYVAGANTDKSGNTFLKVGWNPIWEASGLKSSLPDFGIKIECPDGGCTGLPCSIDPSTGSGSVESDYSAQGAGGSSFCVVTVTKGGKANIVAYDLDSSSDDSDDKDDDKEVIEVKEEEEDERTSTVEPTTSATPTTSEEPTSTTPSSTSTSTTPTSTSVSSTSVWEPSTSEAFSTPVETPTPFPTVKPGIFHENSTTTSDSDETSMHSDDEDDDDDEPTDAESDAAPTSSDDKDGAAARRQGNAPLAGLVVAFIAAVCFF